MAFSLVDALKEYGVDSISLKWPNDVLLQGKKVAGILIETCGQSDELIDYIIGLGVNLIHAPSQTVYPAISVLEATQQNMMPRALLSKVLEHFQHHDKALRQHGFEPFRRRFLELNHFKGEEMHLRVGEKLITGVFKDLSKCGELILELSNGAHKTFSSGDIFLGEPQDATKG